MNDIALAEAVQQAAKPKFHGNDRLKSKVIVHYPANLTDEYERTAAAYMRLLNDTLKEYLPEIRRAIDADRAGVIRLDADISVSRMIRQVMERAQIEFEKKVVTFGLDRKLADLANTVRKRSVREWRRVVKKTLGIDIREDYYMGEFYRDNLRLWTNSNVGLIKTIPTETLTRMENIIMGGYQRGVNNAEMSRLIQEAYGVEKDRAKFIARDQTAKLNAEITQAQQRDAGVEEYTWDASGDGRVRPCHAELDGTRHRWDDPPEMWYMTKHGRVNTGRRCHPGEDYQCRCVALPVFELESLNLPMG